MNFRILNCYSHPHHFFKKKRCNGIKLPLPHSLHPFLFQLYASTRGALWWVTSNPDQLHSIRVVNGAIALVFVVVALEVRVVFHSFARYIQVPPPLNFVLVTITMLGGASATAAYAMGMVSDALSSVVFTTSAIVVPAVADC